MKEYDKENLYHFSPFSPFHMKTGLSCVWVNLLLFILYQKSKLSKHHHSLLPWKWPLCHKQEPVFTGRDSMSEWILKWVKALVFTYCLSLIKHKGAQILHTQLKFKTISNLIFPDTHLPSSFSQTPLKKARKKCLLQTLDLIKILYF